MSVIDRVGGAGPAGTPNPTSHVAVVRWPAESDVLDLVRSLGTPRLVLVDEGARPPLSVDPAEDWVRLPATEEDIAIRTTVLAARAAQRPLAPQVSGDGRLVHQGRWVALSQLEEEMVARMAESFGEVVPTEELMDTGEGRLSVNAVRVHIMRLRKRIEPIGLRVRTVHRHGYVLESV
jgi:Transcriptional regulatory protein, C terminal